MQSLSFCLSVDVKIWFKTQLFSVGGEKYVETETMEVELKIADFEPRTV